MKATVKRLISAVIAFVSLMTVFNICSFALSEKVEIEGNVLKLCTVSQKQYIVPDNVTEICENAFVNCDNLEEIIIGNGVKIIGTGAFSGCANLKLLCLFGTGSISLTDNIADKTKVTVLVNNQNAPLRKAVAMSGYNWASFELMSASGKNILTFLYGMTKEKMISSQGCLSLIEEYHPDYVYFENDNSYYLSKDRTSTEVDFSLKSNPGFFAKFNINMELNKLPDKTDINNGNDRAKNGWLKIFNAIIKAFSK